MADDRKEDEATIKVASKKNPVAAGKGKPGVFKVKLKEKIPKLKEAGTQDAIISEEKKSKATTASNPPSSAPSPGDPLNELGELPRETFTKGYPMMDAPALTSCKWCKKSVLMTTAVEHINGCLRIKKEKANRKKAAREARERAKEQAAREERERRAEEEGITLGVDGDSGDDDDVGDKVPGKTTKRLAGKKTGEGGPSGKKRKADDEAGKAPKQKKKKDEPKPKTKPKGPVDVERQCGVLLPNGQPCARSLTCKSHSMGAKRAVAGRSLPYSMLLAAYQKKNQARQQKAALDANAPVEDDDDANAGPIDSDEETAAVMSALARWNPQPVVPQPVFEPIRREYQRERLRKQLDDATEKGRKNIFRAARARHAGLPPAGVVDQEDAPGEEEDDVVVPMMPGSARSATFAPMQAPRQISVGGPA
ncbi:SAGA complex subunit Sgf73 [Cytospora paraplurivora]|uniref:SAGA complex subunit Sgf73 n=1 Tax=Cytospora paraplurivora TaxID=2898453 RepID=A0AAN9TYS1_9PEZI